MLAPRRRCVTSFLVSMRFLHWFSAIVHRVRSSAFKATGQSGPKPLSSSLANVKLNFAFFNPYSAHQDPNGPMNNTEVGGTRGNDSASSHRRWECNIQYRIHEYWGCEGLRRMFLSAVQACSEPSAHYISPVWSITFKSMSLYN